jgi:hypothetical protein
MKREQPEIGCLTKVFFLMLPTLLMNIFAMWHLLEIHTYMCQFRRRILAIKDEFADTTQSILTLPEGFAEFKRYFWSLTTPLIVLLMFGVFCIAWFLFGNHYTPILIFSLVVLFEVPIFICLRRYHVRRLSDFEEKLMKGLGGKQPEEEK